MIYRICVNDEDIYGQDLNKSVLNPSLEIELNSAGSLNFTLPPEHENWTMPTVFADEVDVYENDEIIWFGRPLQVTRDWNNQKKVVCEGALAYFNDSVQRPKEYKLKNTTLRSFFEDIIATHNDQVGTDRKIYVGNFTVDDVPCYRKVDYETTAECLQRYCLDTDGGYFILRKERDPEHPIFWKRYIDWVADLEGRSDQPVQFGLNMLDIAQDLNGADICTVLIPTGGDNLLVNNVATKIENGCRHVQGEDEISFIGSLDPDNPEGVYKYGRVLKQKEWSDIYDKDQLFQKASEWLKEQNTDIPTIECSAADLHYLPEYAEQYGSDTGRLQVGQKVQIISSVHGIGSEYVLPMYKISMNLDSGVKRITIGTPPKRELTDIVAPTSGGSTRTSGKSGGGSGGGGGGSTYIPVVDVLTRRPGEVAFTSVVSKKKAKIDLSDLGGGDVSDVEVNGISVVDPTTKVASVTIPAPPVVPVQDVMKNGVSVLDQQGIANIIVPPAPVQDVTQNGVSVLNQQGVAQITVPTVIPNPQTTPTSELESIRIGDTTYDIVNSSIKYGVEDPTEGTNGDVYFKLNHIVAGSNYRFIKIQVVTRRGKSNDYTQFARFKLVTNDNTPMSWPSGTTATTNVQCTYNQGPDKLLEDSGQFCALKLPTVIIELPEGNSINTAYCNYSWYTASNYSDRDPVEWYIYFSEDGVNYDLMSHIPEAASNVPTERNVLGYFGKWSDAVTNIRLMDILFNSNNAWLKNIFVKGVTYDGVDIVNSETGIAEIRSSYAIGKVKDIYWRERSEREYEPTSTTRTVTFPEDGVYMCVMFVNCDGEHYGDATLVGSFSLTANGPTIIKEEYLDRFRILDQGEYASGKYIICRARAGDTITFYRENRVYSIIPYQDIHPGDNPHEIPWYERNSSTSTMEISEDLSPNYSKDYYAATSGLTYGSIEHVFKIYNFDERYLAMLGCYKNPAFSRTFDMKSVIPDTEDTFLVYGITSFSAATQPKNYVADGDNYYYNEIGINDDPDIFQSLISSDRKIIHIGDGIYDQGNATFDNVQYNVNKVGYTEYGGNFIFMNDQITYLAIATGKEFHSKSHLEMYNHSSEEKSKYVWVLRLSQPIGVLDVVVDGTSVVDSDHIANMSGFATDTELSAAVSQLQSNFQDGVDSVYNACVSKGSTPASHALADVVNGIMNIPQGGQGGGVDISVSAIGGLLTEYNASVTVSATATITTTATEV